SQSGRSWMLSIFAPCDGCPQTAKAFIIHMNIAAVLLFILGFILLPVISRSAPETTVTIHLERRAQTIEGFGASINAWTAPFYALYYDKTFADYVANDLGMSVFRLEMWAGVTET